MLLWQSPNKFGSAFTYCFTNWLRPFGRRLLGIAQTSLALLSQLDKFNPSVFGTAFVGSVIGDGRGLSFAGSGETVGGDAQFDQFVDDGFRAGFTQCLVGSLVAGAVGMAFDGEFEIGVFFHQGDDTVDFTHTLRFDGRFADIEGDTVGDEFTVRHHAVVQGDGRLWRCGRS